MVFKGAVCLLVKVQTDGVDAFYELFPFEETVDYFNNLDVILLLQVVNCKELLNIVLILLDLLD